VGFELCQTWFVPCCRRREKVEFAPSVYEHAAALIRRSPWEVSRDGQLLFEGHAEAYRRYHHNPIVVGIDIYNLEAEAYGAIVARPEGTAVPAISIHPCSSVAEMERLPHYDPARAGRIPIMLEAAQRIAREFPSADVRIPVSGPFSIACALIGFETLLCESVEEPVRVRNALLHLADGQISFCRTVCDYGLGIAFFESAAAPPLLSPDMFAAVELPALRRVIEGAGAVSGRPVPCIIGGDTAPILHHLVSTGTRYLICPAETDQSVFMSRIWQRTEIRVRINIDLRVLVQRSWRAMRLEVERALALVRGRANVCLGTGALPFETPPENVLRVMEYVKAGI
jgi:uroporphyrinogen decarboxylase